MTTTSNGLVLVDKPEGVTSQQAVVRVRKALGGVRAGHTGTLDPFATGLLLVLLGRATRLASFVADEPKDYDATIRFGSETDTDDSTGNPTRSGAIPSEAAVADAIATLTGDIAQVPPTFSAKHVAGKRAYELARRGVAAELEPVRVRVESWEIIQQTPDSLRARIRCSGGTYIRALARDLGRLTQSAAHCATLRRERCGSFEVTNAVPPDAITANNVRPPLEAVVGLPIERIDARAALGIAHGRPSPATVPGRWAALVADDAELIAVAQRADDAWHPRVVLFDPPPSPPHPPPQVAPRA